MTPGQLLLGLAWPAAAIVFAIGLSIAAMWAAAFWKQPREAGEGFVVMIEAHGIVRVIGVLIIVPAIFGLGVLDKISGAEAITAISAIAGYILGQAAGSSAAERRRDDQHR